MKIKVLRLTPDAYMPTYATPGAACFDLYLPADTPITNISHTHVFGLGLAFEIPKEHVMLVFSRSGHGFNSDMRLANCTGVIDSDYRGELKVKLRIDNEYRSVRLAGGDRIAQAMVLPYPAVEFAEVNELSNTDRGSGGFGSTGS